MKKILFAASEAVPFIKTGGLADVVGSLPKYFDKEAYDVRVMIPKYLCIRQELRENMKFVDKFYVKMNWRTQYVGVDEMEYAKYNNCIYTTPLAAPLMRKGTT